MERFYGPLDKRHRHIKEFAVTERVKAMVAAGVEMKYRGFTEAPKAKARTFQENLVLINPLLPEVLAWILLGFYSERFPTRDVKTIVQELVAANPLQISRPEVRYEYMIDAPLPIPCH